MYTDTRELLARYGVYRIRVAHVGSGKYIRFPRWQNLVSDNSLAKVQNLEIGTTLGTRYKRPACSDYRYCEESTLQQILDLMKRPLNYYVKLELNNRHMMRWEEIAGLNPLRRFKTVTVEVDYPNWQYKECYAGFHPSYEEAEINRQRTINYLRIVLGTHERQRGGPELTIISRSVFEEQISDSDI